MHDLISHFFLSQVPQQPYQGPSCLRVSALTELLERKLILPGPGTAGVICHHIGPGSNVTNFLRFFLDLPTQPQLFTLYSISLSYFFHSLSWELQPSWFTHVYLFLEHRDFSCLVWCYIPSTCVAGTYKCSWHIYPINLKLISTQEPACKSLCQIHS